MDINIGLNRKKSEKILFALIRIALGWTFLWAFLDKMFGLGFTTLSEKSWVMGGSPTAGFLEFATKGPFAEFFQSLAGNPLIDWLFMLGLLLIGLSLMLGVMVRAASFFGIVLLLLMYLAAMPPEHNPLIDDHIIYSLVLFLSFFIPVGTWLGLGKWWSKTRIVRKFPLLK